MMGDSLKWGLDIAKAPAPVQASLEPIVRFFSYHDAHPVAMTMVLLEKFGPDWFTWESETLKAEILTTFRATSISEHNWNKLQAVKTLTSTLGFWREWEIFEKILQALNNNIPRFDISQKCSLAQLMAGVDMANTIRNEEFGEEIQKYVSACSIEEGVTFLPPPLEFGREYLAMPMYQCLDCGTVAEYDQEDERCDYCVGRYSDDKPLNNKPVEGISDDVGRNINIFLTRDPQPAEKRFEEFKSGEHQNVDDSSPEDVQAGKLMVAYNYMLLRRRQLAKQLEEIKTWVTH